MEGKKGKRIFKKILKIFGWIFLSIILLLISVALLIQLPPVQNKIVQKAVSFLEQKIGTDVDLKHISISFPKSIVIEGFYLEDQKKDTLLYAGRLEVDTDLWALTKNEIQVNDLELESVRAYIDRPENDSSYNFSYILQAFADTTQTVDTTAGKPWTFSIEDIAFADIRAKYHDGLTGNFLDLNLGLFEVSVSEFDLENMKVVVDEINLENTTTKIVQKKQPEVTEEVAEENNPVTYDIGVGEVTLENIHADYVQEALGQTIRLDLGRVLLETDKIDLKQQRIDLDEFLMENTFLAYQQRQPTIVSADQTIDPEPQSEKQAEESMPWTVSLNELNLSGNSIQFYDFTKPHTKNAIDFDHLWLNNLAIKAEDILYASDKIKCDLQQFSFYERSGFNLKTLQAVVDIVETKASIQDLLLETGNSKIQFNANATFPSFLTIADNLNKTRFSADINESSIGWRDVLYFNPTLKDSLPVQLRNNERIYVDAEASGLVSNLNIDHFVVKALNETSVRMHGKVTGLPQTDNLRMNISLDRFYTTKRDVLPVVKESLPDSIDLPGWISLKAKYNGSLSESAFSSNLETSDGGVTANGSFDIDSTSSTRGYKVNLTVAKLNLGKIMMDPENFGMLNLQLTSDIKGLRPEEMTGMVKATIRDFMYNGYQYEDFNLDGKVNEGVYSAVATLHDENLNFDFDGKADFSNEVPAYEVALDLKNADFEALKLTNKPLKARGILNTNMKTADFRVLNGDLGLRKVAIFNGEDLYAVDSLLFAALDQEGKSELSINSDLLSANFSGSFNIFSLADELTKYFSTYYTLHDTTTAADKPSGRQHFKFELELRKTELLTDILLPELKTFQPGEIYGEFDSEKKQLDIRLNIKEVQYANIGVKDFVINTNSNAAKLNYNVHVDEILMDSMRVDGLEFNGTVANDSIETNLIVYDSADRTKYLIGAIFNSLEEQYQIRLLPNQVRLNYANWTVSPDNYFRFGGKKLVANNVQLINGREKIIIDSRGENESTLFVGFRELNLEYLVSLIAQPKPVSGLLHGDVFIIPDTANMAFTANLDITEFEITDIPWGNISLDVARKTADKFDVNFGIESEQNKLTVDGAYFTTEKPSMDLTATIARFNLATFEPLTAGQLKDMKGRMTGLVRIKGTPDKPDIDGSINIRDVAFYSTYVKTAFSVANETISFLEEGIDFDSFELRDENKNTAVINGLVLTRDYSDFKLQLDLSADNFRLLNTTEKDNELFYGVVDVDAAVKIRGNTNLPVIDATLGLSDESNITYIVPQSEASVMEGEGVVRFVDKTFEDDPFMKSINPADTVTSEFTGINLTARIELTDEEQFTVIIDPTTGDQLTVRGNATLTVGMDPTGDLSLTGRYEITEGTYNLSFYKFVKREFKIAEGSSMSWSGDPMNAQMDISAIFEVETAPIDLLASRTGATELPPQYKQQLPFQVYLNIDGELLSPEISFRIDMPEEERNFMGGNVYSVIQDINTREADLNKQVFALLILKRFISDNPLENQGSSGLEGTARSSVSKILTDQLNRLSDNVRGVELSFEVESYDDYSSGQAQGSTDLQLGLSKNLFNDRLVVKVAGNVGIEGETTNRQASDYIGDLAVEYKLTEDGRFRITGFRTNEYDLINGELTETGAGLIYVKDYNSLSELFKANSDDDEKK